MTLTLIFLCAAIGLTSASGVLPLNLVNAAVGESVQFNTSLAPTQSQLYSILWKFGAKNIVSLVGNRVDIDPDYQGRIHLSYFTGSLELKIVSLSDVGEYSVSIRPAEGDTAKPGLTILNVYEKITNIVVNSTLMPIEGLSANFNCDASGSILTREWIINGILAHPSENIVFLNQMREMFIVVVNRTYTGKVTCSLSNPIDRVVHDFVVNVNYGPGNAQIPEPGAVHVGTTLKLSCSAESVPPASYTWIKNGTTLAQSQNYTKEKIEISDSGEYTCRATNNITMISSETSLTLRVTEPPKKGLSAGAIVGITLAVLVVVAGAAGGGFYIYKLKYGE